MTAGTVAQEIPSNRTAQILVINQELLLNGSNLGQHILALEQLEQAALIEEGSTKSEVFIAEELALTSQRDTLSAEEFRALADDFDTRVEAYRTESALNDRALLLRAEARRRLFFQINVPILGAILRKYRSAAILDHRSLLLFDTSLDITQEAIEQLDIAFEENPNLLDAQ